MIGYQGNDEATYSGRALVPATSSADVHLLRITQSFRAFHGCATGSRLCSVEVPMQGVPSNHALQIILTIQGVCRNGDHACSLQHLDSGRHIRQLGCQGL